MALVHMITETILEKVLKVLKLDRKENNPLSKQSDQVSMTTKEPIRKLKDVFLVSIFLQLGSKLQFKLKLSVLEPMTVERNLEKT